MAGPGERKAGSSSVSWRPVLWCGAFALLLIPLIANLLSDDEGWTFFDFVVAGILIGGVGLAFELALRMTANRAYRAGAAVALATAFLLIWANLAVGIVGDEGNPANLIFFAVVGIAIVGSIIARFRPLGMMRAMLATAMAQVGAALTAVAFSAARVGLANFFFAFGFVVLWMLAAWLFRRAAREPMVV